MLIKRRLVSVRFICYLSPTLRHYVPLSKPLRGKRSRATDFIYVDCPQRRAEYVTAVQLCKVTKIKTSSIVFNIFFFTFVLPRPINMPL